MIALATVVRAVRRGGQGPTRRCSINGYNGGLFAPDPALDALIVTRGQPGRLRALADYDFETDLNVNILGHIFEQSITDLEAIRAEIRGEVG